MTFEKRTVFVAYTNTDLTEGRGNQIPLAVCKSESTARRLGKGKYVQGTDCPVHELELLKIGNDWYGPIGHICVVNSPSKEDEEHDKAVREARELARKQSEVLERMRAAGFSDEDIALMKSSQKVSK